MTGKNNATTQSIHATSLGKCMLLGAGIALILISIFLLGAGRPNPAWGKLWMIRPLIIVPLAGGLAGACYYMMDFIRYQGGWKKVVSNIICVIGYIIALWLGTVLGLAGTMWD